LSRGVWSRSDTKRLPRKGMVVKRNTPAGAFLSSHPFLRDGSTERIFYGMLQAYGESFEILYARQSGQDESFLIKAITALPNESGGHAIKAE